MTRILVLNGPNLASLGRREPERYGTATFGELVARLGRHADELGLTLRCEQSNHEGVLVDLLEEEAGRSAGVVVNPGGLGHTSVVLRDAYAAFPGPVVEVHITNVHAREPFRHVAVTAGAATGMIAGLGQDGYLLALEALRRLLGGTTEDPA